MLVGWLHAPAIRSILSRSPARLQVFDRQARWVAGKLTGVRVIVRFSPCSVQEAHFSDRLPIHPGYASDYFQNQVGYASLPS